MKYEYTFRNTAGDYWKFYMGNTYHTMMAVVNIVFTAAMIALAVARFGQTNILGKILIVIGICIFPVLQPIAVYLRSRQDAAKVNRVDTCVSFDEDGMEIRVQGHVQKIRWKDFQAMMKRGSMLIAIPDGVHAYLLTNRIVGEQKEALYQFVTAHLNH